MKSKNGFVLKHVLILLLSLTSITFSITHYYQQTLNIYHQSLLLEKQKAAELILYSYFMSHLKNNESKNVSTTTMKMTYSISSDEKVSKLESRICFESCYYWKLEYDRENQQMITHEYNSDEE